MLLGTNAAVFWSIKKNSPDWGHASRGRVLTNMHEVLGLLPKGI